MNLPRAKTAYCPRCTKAIFSYDIDEPNYRKNIRKSAIIEEKIYQLCSLTGKSFREVKRYVEDNDLDIEKLNNLIYRAGTGDWRFDDETQDDAQTPEA